MSTKSKLETSVCELIFPGARAKACLILDTADVNKQRKEGKSRAQGSAELSWDGLRAWCTDGVGAEQTTSL